MTQSTDGLYAQRNWWTIANMLSISRVVLTIPIVYFLVQEGDTARWVALFLIAIAILTDSLDGKVARARNEITEEGKFLDPLADKIAVGVVAFVLAIMEILPWWFVGIVLGRDVLIILAGIYIKYRYGILFPSNTMGKWAVTVISFTVFVVLLPIDGLDIPVRVMMIASVLMLISSTISYTIRFIEAGKVVQSYKQEKE
jgi:CDP-diacylglycerol--glycerol-3-phosphate 3-phosphatidyltransferase